MTNESILALFLGSKRAQNLSSATLKAYGYDLRDFIVFTGLMSVTKTTVAGIRKYLVYLENKELAPATIRRKLATLKSFYSFIVHDNLATNSPTLQLTGNYKIPRRLPRILSTLQIESLLRVAFDQVHTCKSQSAMEQYRVRRNHVMMELLVSTGIRICELLNLNCDDIDIHSRRMIIFGKGRRERILHLSSDEVCNSIQEFLTAREALTFAEPAMFLNRFGARLSYHSVRSIFRAICRNSGIKTNATPHCLRHTLATMLIENGADVRSVQEILGHSSISTTEIYLSVSSRHKEQIFNKFNPRNALRITGES